MGAHNRISVPPVRRSRRSPGRWAGGKDVLEYWIPAEDLDEFDAHIVGPIVCEAEYTG
ncbi:hypothetical protein BN6_43380 [Saccharothrix espanaensis DSM 44229]|uniref:Uncharacterized protein n=1 Tax=Saccharothrix espanaensis (strain ATCC 51144 / DSM 44229 / JCM 9112 / NBRC 15066 / NRRL 15764) TaxID=1179773 RepID=K0JUW0_SACES|nr:hypothetical protein BN6_43380 [Saccharothrix espanaensis DSM 44229]